MSLTNFPNGITSFGIPMYGDGGIETSGQTYFVDGNSGGDGNSGKSWNEAFKTLAFAFSVSHANIAASSKGWAARNKIYIKGDSFEESLVAFPQKTDVIGVGSYNGMAAGANILGNHAPVNAAVGTRFYNVNFEPVTTDDIMVLTGVCWGAQFVNCRFKASGTLIAKGAIDATACPHLQIINCDFVGAFTGDVIDIGAGAASDTIIQGNRIIGGADNGIVVTGTATITGGRRGLIADNYIDVADKVIDTGSTSVFSVINNICISGEALGAGSYVIDLTYAAKNLITGNDVSVGVPSYTTVA